MSLVFLTKDDVSLVRNGNGKEVLKHNIRGYSLILFYSPKAETCREFDAVFKQIPNEIQGCQIGKFIVDVDRTTISLCKKMFDNIPYIVLYFDGMPFMAYDGPADKKTLCDFIIEIASRNRMKQQFAPPRGDASNNGGRNAPPQPPPPPKNQIFGIPLYGKDDVKYFVFDSSSNVGYVSRK